MFFPLATQLGQENEAIRNLLLDAGHKISELDAVKQSIVKLLDPVANTLRAYEETKNEKLHLQGVLNSTRIAHNKARQDLASAEKKAATLESECARLSEAATVAQQSATALERIKSEQAFELNARRTQVVEMQRQIQQQSSELQATRDENRRIGERFADADRRMAELESEAQTAQQKAMQATNEREAVQVALDKTLNDYTQTSRKLTEAEKALTAAVAKMKTMESGLAEAQMDRNLLSDALDEANHNHLEEMNLQSARFEALQARSTLTENLLDEARQALTARNEEVRALERRVADSTDAHGTTGERLAQVTSALAEREQQLKDLEQSLAALSEQSQTLSNAVVTRESAYNRAQQKIKEQEELLSMVEVQFKSARDKGELQIEQLNAELQRERIERAVAEGALESGRKDLARLMREIAALQERREAAATTPRRRARDRQVPPASKARRNFEPTSSPPPDHPAAAFAIFPDSDGLPTAVTRTSSRIARSSPSSVSGYIRSPISWRIMRIEWVCSHSRSGTGLSQTQAG